jgi:histidine phosphotransferase ChpT
VTGDPDNDALLLAGALAARLCHDLAGPLGTVSGALDLAERADAEALALAREATTDLAHRLRLYRACWAEGAGPGSVAELAALAQGLAHRRVRLDVGGLPGQARMRPEFGRVVLNALLLAAEGMPRGGTVALQGDPELDVAVTLNGPGAAWPPGTAEAIANPGTALARLRQHSVTMQPRAVLAPLTALLAAREGLRLGLLMGPASVQAPPLLITRA